MYTSILPSHKIGFSVRLFILCLFVLLAGGITLAQDESVPFDEIDKLSQVVVMIITYKDGEPYAQGSGIIASPTGLIYTNRHVIEGADDYAIYMIEDINEQPVLKYHATPLKPPEGADFAILQIDRDADGNILFSSRLKLPYIDPVESSATLARRGDKIYVLGYPSIADGYFAQVEGRITTVRNGDIGGERMITWYQTDAEISSGNSGGLAVNSSGKPLGIPTTVRSDEAGGRFGGILPFAALVAWIEYGPPVVPNPDEQPTPEGGTAGGKDIEALIAKAAEDENWTCDNLKITNGTRVTVVQMRTGFYYTATVLGIGDFDPVLMVINPDQKSGFCNDDDPDAAGYAIRLPQIGTINANASSAHVRFSQTAQAMADMSLIVGGKDGMAGSFIVILEGMAVTSADGAGDPFRVKFTKSMVRSQKPMAVFMIGNERKLNPLVLAATEKLSQYETIYDTGDNPIACDNSGNQQSCWGTSYDLSDMALVGSQGRINADVNDSMLMMSPSAAVNADYQDMLFLMSSSNRASTGKYTLVLYMGVQ